MEPIIISHEHPVYIRKRRALGGGRYNGAYYYSQEIIKNIIPNVKTDRNWITVNIPPYGADHAIVFIHNNLHPERYEWLKKYNDLILVCGVEETVEKVAHLGKAIYLPISIDVEYVKQFKLSKEERQGIVFAGRPQKHKEADIPPDTPVLAGIPREDMLKKLARFETVFAVGRTAIEAKCLGCKLKAYDPRYPKVSKWKVLDNKTAAAMLQEQLDEIDG